MTLKREPKLRDLGGGGSFCMSLHDCYPYTRAYKDITKDIGGRACYNQQENWATIERQYLQDVVLRILQIKTREMV